MALDRCSPRTGLISAHFFHSKQMSRHVGGLNSCHKWGPSGPDYRSWMDLPSAWQVQLLLGSPHWNHYLLGWYPHLTPFIYMNRCSHKMNCRKSKCYGRAQWFLTWWFCRGWLEDRQAVSLQSQEVEQRKCAENNFFHCRIAF